MLAAWQAYQSLYYEKKLKAVVEQRWAEYLAELPEGAEPKMSRVQMSTKVAIEKFDSEEQDVKDEVKAYRQKQPEAPEELGDAERIQEYARYGRSYQIKLNKGITYIS